MSRFFLFLVFVIAGLNASSQKVYFIYFQSESEQPFYLKVGEKVNPSTASGYLILSKLRDSTYTFSLGFPGDKWPEQQFSVAVNKKDHGYLLKNFGEKGWGLFDLQSMAVHMPVTGAAGITPGNKDNKEVSDFTEVLSKAAGDPSLKEKPVPANEEVTAPVAEKKEEPVKVAPEEKKTEMVSEPVVKRDNTEKPAMPTDSIKKVDPPAVVKEEEKTVQPEVPAASTEYRRSVVTRRSESSTTEGFGLVFTDEIQPGTVDTIRLVIPNPRQALVSVVQKEEPKEEKKFLDIAATDSTKTAEQTKPVEEARNPVIETKPVAEIPAAGNKNCTAIAEENDFFEIRKRMAAETSDDNMIAEAKKYFKTKCFTTQQVRNLSLLFLNEEGKYHFFDAAYPYTSDPANYAALQSELKDTYYINRFRAMLRL